MSGDNRPNADELVKQYGIDWDLKGVYNSFTGALTNVQGGTLLTISEGHSPAVVGTERTKHGHLFGPQGGQTWIAVTVDNPYVLLINPLENKVIQATGVNENVITVPATKESVRDKKGHWLAKFVNINGEEHYRFEHSRLRAYLELADGKAAAGTPVRTSPSSNDDKQLWKYVKDGFNRPKGYGPKG